MDMNIFRMGVRRLALTAHRRFEMLYRLQRCVQQLELEPWGFRI